MQFVRLTMPVNGRIDGQSVGHEYFNFISFINFNQRARLLTVDEVDIATDTVWSLSVERYRTRSERTGCFDLPGALTPRWTVKSYVLRAALDCQTFKSKNTTRTDIIDTNILLRIL